jgi:cytochrome c oxidase subunit IV
VTESTPDPKAAQRAADHDAADVDRWVRRYLIVFAALAALTVVTVAVYSLHLPPAGAVAVALAIAGVKASLVACYFMHLIDERRLIYTLLGFIGVFLMALLLGPVLTDLERPDGGWAMPGRGDVVAAPAGAPAEQ